MWSNGIKIAFFQKITKKSSSGFELRPRPPSAMRLSYTSLLNTSSKLDISAFQLLI